MSNVSSALNLNPQIDRILAALDERPNAYLVAVVGIPGSGKSTLCSALGQRLRGSVGLPMDGYHLPRCQLSPEEAARQVQFNDLVNARLILDDGGKERADLILQGVA